MKCKFMKLGLYIQLSCILFAVILPMNLYSKTMKIGPSLDFQTIQQAIDAAAEGDEIIVYQGLYIENISFLGKNVLLRSIDPTSDTVVVNTIIDGNSNGPVVLFSGTELTTCVLEGFTITNGDAYVGGGVYGGPEQNPTHATIRNNIITANKGYGALIYCDGLIENNIISSNSYGGLLCCDGIIQDNRITANNGTEYDGAVEVCNGIIRHNYIMENNCRGLAKCDGTIQNNIIALNKTTRSAAGLSECDGLIFNNTIVNNSAKYKPGGIANCGGLIVNCILWGNTPSPQADHVVYPFYSCIQDWTLSGRGVITDNPQFVDEENKNYHLQAGSKCIDGGYVYYLMGESFVDFDGNCRLAGTSVDMGCYEYDSSIDNDGDLLSDQDEIKEGLNPTDVDTDGDGLTDRAELIRGTSPAIKDVPQGISIPLQYDSIQKAVFLSFPGEIITVSPGTYHDNLYFGGKNIGLQSVDPQNIQSAQNTVINGDRLFSVARFKGTEDGTCVLQGLTLTNGRAKTGGGISGGSYFYNNTITIKNNRINNNYASGGGGGIFNCGGLIQGNSIINNSGESLGDGGGISYCSGDIIGNTISNNTAGFGGGLSYCNGLIQNNIITSNKATENSGGGINQCNGLIINNEISGNTAENTGGGLAGCDGTIRNNTITGNIVTSLWGYGVGISLCDGLIQDNIIDGNIASGKEVDGGGIYVCAGIIENNVISNNVATKDGGGIYASLGLVQNNVIKNNKAILGGGVYYCNDLRNNVILNNQASDSGGGLYKCRGRIQNNLICGNIAINNGGGLYLCSESMVNNTVVGNNAQNAGGGFESCTGLIVNCIIWNNSAPTGQQIYNSDCPFFSCIQDWNGASRGNISYDPLFEDPSQDNYHLSQGSPCIDTGSLYHLDMDANGDIDGECRLHGATVDIGCDEWDSSPDQDGDFLSDSDEQVYLCDPLQADMDEDGLMDGVEIIRGTNPIIKNIPENILIPDHYPTIQQAIFLSFPDETITVSPGIYNENLYLGGRDLVLQSNNPQDLYTISITVLDGNALHSVITYRGDENSTSTIKGFTIRNGNAIYGGGINCNSANSIIQNNIITKNYAQKEGGGIYDCYGEIMNNIISSNFTSGNGGGISRCDYTMHNNIITSNTAVLCGGGGYQCLISRNNIISYNRAFQEGGGLYFNEDDYNGSLWTLFNNDIYGNIATLGGGLSGYQDMYDSIIYNNYQSSGLQIYYYGVINPYQYCYYSCIQDWSKEGYGGYFNINNDPKLVSPGNGDFHLSDDSPCIDTGYTSTSYSYYDFCIPPGKGTTKTDMGAYGGDYNCYWNILTADHKYIMEYILGKGVYPIGCDQNNDGIIDVSDIIYLVK